MPRRRRPAPVKPVAGPGALSERTDRSPQGAAASRGQPVRVAPGGDYGSRKALVEQQQAAPLAAGAPQGLSSRAVDALRAPVQGAASAFGPTTRPREPITAGAATGAGPGPNPDFADPDLLLQAMYGVLPAPGIARLLMSEGNL